MSGDLTISTEEEKIRIKYSTYKRVDPFPDIPAALLNSADIQSYVNATGMIFPFDQQELKSASYAAKIAGECRYWDEGKKIFKIVFLSKEGDKLVLRPNSIAFVGIEPTFRLPDYIALRFNLKISNVYRGLLLGTGPLIDPGFEGKIYIPLHNLTSNEYVFSYGESLIWIEFTKTSPIQSETEIEKDSNQEQRCGNYIKFPEDKKYKKLDYYIGKALNGYSFNEVVSSIPTAIANTKKSAEAAEKSAASAEKRAKSLARYTIWGSTFGAVVVIAALCGICAILWDSWNLQRMYLDQALSKSVVQIEQLNHNNINKIMESIFQGERRLSNISTQIDTNIQNIIEHQNKEISLLNNRIEQLEKKINIKQANRK